MAKPRAPEGQHVATSVARAPFADADARVFVTVTRAGSFARAATLLRMTPSAVSKAVSRLESALGVRLLARTTRSLHLSDEGIVFRDRCERAFALLSDAQAEISESARALGGTLRIGAPPIFGTYFLPSVIAQLRAEHPGLRVEVVSTMRPADLVDRRLDVAIAVGPLEDSSFVVRPLGYGQFVLVGSPGYFEARSIPKRPSELTKHALLAYVRPDGRDAPVLLAGGRELSPDRSVVVRSDDMHHLAAMASAGLGIAQLPLFIVARALAEDTLVRVLETFDPEPKLASLIFPSGRAVPRRVRVLVEAMTSPRSEMPGATAKQGRPAKRD